MKKILALLVVLVMVLGLAACASNSENTAAPEENAPAAESAPAEQEEPEKAEEAPAEEETPAAEEETPAEPEAIEVDPNGESFTFVVNISKGEPASAHEIAWMDAITEQSLGRIQFECYYSNSLLTPAEVPNGMQTGVVDIAVSSISEWPDICPRSAYVTTMPFAGITGTEMYEIYAQLRQEYPEIDQEYLDADMRLLTFGFGPPLNIFTVKEADLSAPENLHGMQMLATQTMLQELISAEGGAPVMAGPPDFYSYLERSVSDGIFIHWGMITNFALCEVVDQATIFGEAQDAGITQDMNVVVISEKVWQELPDDLKAVFEANVKTYWDAHKVTTEKLITNGYDALDTEGAAVVHLTDDQVKLWSDAFSPVRDATLTEVDANGCNATEIYTRMLELAGK